MNINTYYEARLKKSVDKKPYGKFGNKKRYVKGTIIQIFSAKQFNKLTAKNLTDNTVLSITEGHGVYVDFNVKKHIEFVRVQTIIKKKIIKLKK